LYRDLGFLTRILFMVCIIYKDSEDISLGVGEILFFCECDGGRTLLISGQYFKRFELPEILSRIGEELRNTTIEIQRS
jgi:hypothetical protein